MQAGASDDWARSRAHQQKLQNSDATTAAAEYFAAWPHHPPDFFRDTTRKRRYLMHQAFGEGQGWACRLLSCVPDLHHYSLHHHHLGLSEADAAPELIFDPANIRLWQETIKATFSGPLYWCRELGEDGAVHHHVLAGAEAGLLHIPRGGKVAGPVWGLEGLLSYLCKPVAPYTAPNLAIWLEAKKRGRLPRMSGTMRLPNSSTWNCSQPNPVPSARIVVSPQSEPVRISGMAGPTPHSQPGLLTPERAPWLALALLPSSETVVPLAGRHSLRAPVIHSRLWAEAALAPPRPLA
jgi:hypothetical protein